MSRKSRVLKNSKVLTVRLECWDDAILLARRLFSHVFRGQGDERWVLSTTLERVADRYEFPKDFLKNREDVILNHFQRRGHHFINSPPPFDNRLEWLSILQHHGGPTRLLDFTHSFYVAAFFAIEVATTDAAVWAVERMASHSHIEWPWTSKETIIDRDRQSREIAEKNIGNYEPIKLVMDVEPERLNMRMAAQQGLFLMPGDLDFSFMDNLLATYDCSKSEYEHQLNNVIPSGKFIAAVSEADGIETGIVKIVIPREFHNRGMRELIEMNIHSDSIFPDLDGFARSLSFFLRDAE